MNRIQLLRFAQRSLLGGLTGLGLLFIQRPVAASETVVFNYSFFQETIPVEELATFAETGEISPSLRFLLDRSQQEPEQFRQTLTQEVTVDPVLLYRVLNTIPGELALGQISQIIRTPTNRANVPSLRSALVGSALPDEQITLLEVLENYPTAEVYVEGDRLLDVLRILQQITDRIPDILLPGQ